MEWTGLLFNSYLDSGTRNCAAAAHKTCGNTVFGCRQGVPGCRAGCREGLVVQEQPGLQPPPLGRVGGTGWSAGVRWGWLESRAVQQGKRLEAAEVLLSQTNWMNDISTSPAAGCTPCSAARSQEQIAADSQPNNNAFPRSAFPATLHTSSCRLGLSAPGIISYPCPFKKSSGTF